MYSFSGSCNTNGHDTGWSSYPEDHGTCNNSWTWFEAGLELNAEGGREQPPRRPIQVNVHAKRDATTHVNIWGGSEGEREADEWLDKVRVWDILHVFPKALYTCWTNSVDRMRVSVFYAWM